MLDGFCHNHAAAVEFLKTRPGMPSDGEGSALDVFMKELKWEFRTPHSIQSWYQDGTIVHEFVQAKLGDTSVWGTLHFFDDDSFTLTFDTVECFAAYCISRFS